MFFEDSESTYKSQGDERHEDAYTKRHEQVLSELHSDGSSG